MHFTEAELFDILVVRFREYAGSGYAKGSKEHKSFVDLLKAFTESFIKEETKQPKSAEELLYEHLAAATADGNLEAVQAYSQAIQRLS